VIFDGGIPASTLKVISPWVSLIEPVGLGKADSSLEMHGLAVTSAALFGPLKPDKTSDTPACLIDHVRVLDQDWQNDIEAWAILDRIDQFLKKEGENYQLVNLSLGPDMAVDDDEVTRWTSVLDDHFATSGHLAFVAAGNNGARDSEAGLDRICPPSDGVNLLCVGAADSRDLNWSRAPYSAQGPGRAPGMMKPDILAFGGSLTARGLFPQGFAVLEGSKSATVTQGTSFAAPFALRTAASVLAQRSNELSPLAVRALLVHRAEQGENDVKEVGWGRIEENPLLLVTCDDNEALILFQGKLPVGSFLRAPVPLSEEPLIGTLSITATLVILSDVDPEHPGAYTRGGMEIVFRPHDQKINIDKKSGKRSFHPKTQSNFFSTKDYHDVPEQVLRSEGLKWETTRKGQKNKRLGTLRNPCFDIYYNHRDEGGKNSDPQQIPYALVIGVRSEKDHQLYNKVLSRYRNRLIPIKQQQRIQVGR